MISVPGSPNFKRGSVRRIPQAGSFASAAPEAQIDYLRTVDRTAFFEAMRMLTLLGMFSSPKYGGNFQGIGWKMMGFEDQHVFTPPFGYYDREYTGFVPYATEQASVSAPPFKPDETVDFVVVGSGAAGGVHRARVVAGGLHRAGVRTGAALGLRGLRAR